MGAILVINPGSTSTKLAVFANHELLAEETIRHTVDEIEQFEGVIDQTAFRKQLILEFIETYNFADELVAIVGRGGLLKPIPGGTYYVDDAMLEDLLTEKYNTHASNLGGILAHEFGQEYHVPAFIVDPVVVDEMMPIARISGLKGIERRSVAHVLNQKAVARKILEENSLTYEEGRVIVAHLGGGISVGAHANGKMIDVVNGLDGEGAYSPERSGTLPLIELSKIIIDNEMTLAEVKSLIAGHSGMKSYLNETDLRNIQEKVDNGDEVAKYYLDGMCYQVAKSIAEMSVTLEGKLDYIILTGGASHSKYILEKINQYVSWMAPVEVYPGEMEMEALYEGARRVLEGEEEVRHYADETISRVGVK